MTKVTPFLMFNDQLEARHHEAFIIFFQDAAGVTQPELHGRYVPEASI